MIAFRIVYPAAEDQSGGGIVAEVADGLREREKLLGRDEGFFPPSSNATGSRSSARSTATGRQANLRQAEPEGVGDFEIDLTMAWTPSKECRRGDKRVRGRLAIP